MACSSCSKTLGLAGLVSGMLYGPATFLTQRERMKICQSCTAVDSSGRRLFREVGDNAYCGEPKTENIKDALLSFSPSKLFRDEVKDGCGCELNFKTSRNEAECPLKKWLAASAEIDQQKAETLLSQFATTKGEINVITPANRGAEIVVAAYAIAGLKELRPAAAITWSVPQHLIPWAMLFPVAENIAPLEVQGRQYGETMVTDVVGSDLGKHEAFAMQCGAKPLQPPVSIKAEDLAAGAVNTDGGALVVLAPLEASSSFTWSQRRWLELEDWLIKQGLKTIVIDPDRNGNLTPNFRSTRLFAPAPGVLAAVIKQAVLVIGGDTSVMHLAGALDVRALPICGPVDGLFEFSEYKSITWIESVLPCRGCGLRPDSQYTRFCDFSCEALMGISFEQVRHRCDLALDQKR